MSGPSRAWDVERTKRLLLEAATTEFGEHGLAGARVDRIAASAGVNKERIYQYFGSKLALVGAAIAAELARALDAAPIEGTGVEAVTTYAGRVFDYHSAHPQLARLTLWEGLETATPAVEDVRRAGARDKIAQLRAAVPELSERDAAGGRSWARAATPRSTAASRHGARANPCGNSWIPGRPRRT